MNAGVRFENIQVNGVFLIIGHHRYLSSLLLNKEIGINTWERPSNFTFYNWSEIEIDETDRESKRFDSAAQCQGCSCEWHKY
jgi:hypothetical protein